MKQIVIRCVRSLCRTAVSHTHSAATDRKLLWLLTGVPHCGGT
jgi:hypothetical protein